MNIYHHRLLYSEQISFLDIKNKSITIAFILLYQSQFVIRNINSLVHQFFK